MNPGKKVLTVLNTVKGWLTLKEGLFLYHTARQLTPNTQILEIGSWKGRSTLCLAHGSVDGHSSKIYAVDPHTGSSEHTKGGNKVDTFEEFNQNTREYTRAGIIIPLRQTSEEAAKIFEEEIKFLFIDGAHEFRFVRQDLKLWIPKVVDGGIIALHDSWHFPGVNLASVIVLLFSNVRHPKLVDTITYFEKCSRVSFKDRIDNAIFILYRTLFGLKGFINLKYRGSNP